MKLLCDVCEKAQATEICCADEAALCAKCDVEVHAANKLARKHQRMQLLHSLNKLPPCDICQEKSTFIFCVEDRALLCKDCNEPIHSGNNNSLASNHQRFLATGIRVALVCNDNSYHSHIDDPKKPKKSMTAPVQNVLSITSSSWDIDELLLQFSDHESSDKFVQKEQRESCDFEWLTGINNLFDHENIS